MGTESAIPDPAAARDGRAALRESVLGFAERALGSRGGNEKFSRSAWNACAEFGILGLPVPVEYGGAGEDGVAAVVAFEALGYACRDQGLLFSLQAHLWSVVMGLLELGSPEQKAAWIPPLIDGTWVAAHGMSEPDSGSDAFALRTRAERDGDDYVLTGAKTFVTNAPVADVFIIFATVNPKAGMWGLTAFVVDRDTPGLTVSRPFEKMGLAGSAMGEVVLDGCRVGADRRLGEEGQGVTLFTHSMAWERGCILASLVGRMERQLEECIAYAQQRRQFGRSIGDNQLIAGKLADMKVRHETSRLLLYRAAAELPDGAAVQQLTAMAKLHISEAAVQSSLDAVQIHGGYGYMAEYSPEQELRDAVAGTLYSGTSEIQRLLIARSLGLQPT
jgi:L-prolyl-PCP dehydrogenase